MLVSSLNNAIVIKLVQTSFCTYAKYICRISDRDHWVKVYVQLIVTRVAKLLSIEVKLINRVIHVYIFDVESTYFSTTMPSEFVIRCL